MLVLLWCFICLHVQEWHGRTCPKNTTISVIEFVMLPFLSYLAKMVMVGGDDGQAGCLMRSTIQHTFCRV